MDASVLSALEVPPLMAGWFDVFLGNLQCYVPLLLLSGLIGWLLRHLFGGKQAEQERTSLRARLAGHETQLGSLTADLTAAREGRGKLEADLGGLRTQFSAVTADLAAAKSARTALDLELGELQGKLAAVTGELTAARHGYAGLETTLKTRETELAECRNRYLLLEKDQGAAKAQHGSLTAEIARLTAAAGAAALLTKTTESSKQGLETEIIRLRNELATTVNAKAVQEVDLTGTLHQRGLDLSKALSVCGDLDSTIAKLRTDLDATKTQHNSVTGEVTKIAATAAATALALKTAESAKQSHEAELARLRQELATTVNAKAVQEVDLTGTLHQRGLDLSKALSVRDDLNSTIAKLRTDLDATKTQHSSVTGEVAKFAATAAATALALKAAESAKQSHEAELARLRQELATTVAAKADQEQDLSATLKQRGLDLSKALSVHEDLKTELNAARESFHSARSAVTRQAEEAVTLRTQLADAQTEKLRLAAETPATRIYVTACPQHLSDVTGIGSVYEQRLYAAGIGTYAELAALAPELMGHLLDLSDAQKATFDFNAVRADAQRLARESNSAGRRWSRSVPDDLEPLAGIGPAFEKRLYDAGICTYEALCQATPELLAEIIKAPDHLKPDFAHWIAQGCQLSRKRNLLAKYSTAARDPNDETPYSTRCPQHLSDVKGIGTVFETRLYAGGVGTFWDLSRLDRAKLFQVLDLDERQQQTFPFEEMKADAARLASESHSKGRTWLRNPPDDLEPLKGIGYTYEKRLYDAGFCTYESVCEATPEVLDEICQGPKLNKPDYASWISQACTLAQQKNRSGAAAFSQASRNPDDESPYKTRCPQHLSDVVGIGSVFEGRLYACGVGTYWQLSKVTNAEFNTFLELSPRQQETFGYEATRADALRLARETKSKGREWASVAPDDLEPLEGIGHTFEKRLYDAGICTYAALAEATPEQLNEICHPPAHNLPDFVNWIAQARKLVKPV